MRQMFATTVKADDSRVDASAVIFTAAAATSSSLSICKEESIHV